MMMKSTQPRFTISLRAIFIIATTSMTLIVLLSSLVPTSSFWFTSLSSFTSASQKATNLHIQLYRDNILNNAVTDVKQILTESSRISNTITRFITRTSSLHTTLLTPASTAQSLAHLFHPLFLSFPALSSLHRAGLSWQTSDGCQHMFLRTFPGYLLTSTGDDADSYTIWDNCISTNVTFLLYNGSTPTTIELPFWMNLPDLSSRLYWTAAHNPALIHDHMAWTVPYLASGLTSSKIISLAAVSPTVSNASDPVSFISWVAVTTEGLHNYLTTVLGSQSGIVFLTTGTDADLTLIAGSNDLIANNTWNNVLAINSPDTLTREVAATWLASGKPSTFSLASNHDLLVDVRSVPVNGAGSDTFRLFLVTNQNDFLGSITDANNKAIAEASTTMACVIASEGVVFVVILIIAVLFSVRLSHSLMKICKKISCVANLEWDDSPTDPAVPNTGRHSEDGGGRASSRGAPITELRRLQEEADRMEDALVSFGKFVSTAVVRHVVKEKLRIGVTQTTAAVMFLDIVDFTHTMDCRGVHMMMEVLAIMFEKFTKIIGANGGIVDKFIGDAIMAVWNVPDPINDPAKRAMLTVGQIIAELDELNKTVFEPQMAGLRMKVRIGVNYGEVYAGNVGSRDRLNYTVIGNTVNLASRLEYLNKSFETSVMVPDDVRLALMDGEDDSCDLVFRCLGFTQIRGVSKPVRVHEFLGLRSKMTTEQAVLLANYDAVEKEFMAMTSEQSDALCEIPKSLREYVTCFPGDRPAQRMVKMLTHITNGDTMSMISASPMMLDTAVIADIPSMPSSTLTGPQPNPPTGEFEELPGFVQF